MIRSGLLMPVSVVFFVFELAFASFIVVSAADRGFEEGDITPVRNPLDFFYHPLSTLQAALCPSCVRDSECPCDNDCVRLKYRHRANQRY